MIENKIKPRKCPFSGEEFYPHRSNQRFASPENRIAYHNYHNNKVRLERACVDRRLHHNHSILLKLMKNKLEKSFSEQYLLGKGFSFFVLTHFDFLEGSKVRVLYDFTINFDKDMVIIKKLQS